MLVMSKIFISAKMRSLRHLETENWSEVASYGWEKMQVLAKILFVYQDASEEGHYLKTCD